MKQRDIQQPGAARVEHQANMHGKVEEQAPFPSLLYLYCVIESNSLGVKLIEEQSVAGVAPTMDLFSIEYEGLAAVVSGVPAAIFTEEAINSIVRDVSGLAPIALRHEEVMQTMLANAPAVIPVSMGVVFRSKESVVNLLRDEQQRFQHLLDRVKHSTEWGIKVFRNTPKLTEAAQVQSPELLQIDQQIAESSPGRAYLLRRQKDRDLGLEVDRFMHRCLDDIVSVLRQCSVDIKEEDLPKVESGSLPVVLKTALLVRNDAFGAFKEAVEGIEKRYVPIGLRPEMNGPWAPYSFVGRRND